MLSWGTNTLCPFENLVVIFVKYVLVVEQIQSNFPLLYSCRMKIKPAQDSRPNCIYNSITAMRNWQLLHFSWTTLRDKHCRDPIAIMGNVDTFGSGPCNIMLSFDAFSWMFSFFISHIVFRRQQAEFFFSKKFVKWKQVTKMILQKPEVLCRFS